VNPWARLRRKARRALARRCRVDGSPFTFDDLQRLDALYRAMWESHEAVHRGAIGELAGRGLRTALEVACGTGWNAPLFAKAGLAYAGLDVSETAVAAAAMKHPESRWHNLGIGDTSVLADGAYDVVYSSSMLEHVGDHRAAILEMVRIARREVRVLFFEGLTDAAEDVREFHPVTPAQIAADVWSASRTDPTAVERNVFGRKIVLQDQGEGRGRGWWWNRYAKAPVLALFSGSPHAVRLLGRGDRPWIADETVLVVEKAAQ
jgi:SAM-dependent methyltransferase